MQTSSPEQIFEKEVQRRQRVLSDLGLPTGIVNSLARLAHGEHSTTFLDPQTLQYTPDQALTRLTLSDWGRQKRTHHIFGRNGIVALRNILPYPTDPNIILLGEKKQ